MALRDRVSTAMSTHVGNVRTNNEDAIAEDGQIGLLVLADGMGGYNAGEIAAGLATASIVEVVRREWHNIRHGEIDPESGFTPEATLLRNAVESAHSTIFHVAQTQPQCAGMGTTVVACVFHDNRISVAHVGDSRLYRLRQGHLEQLTRDHSLLEELVARGHYTREEAGRLVRKNIVTRALGVESEVNVDLIEDEIQIGDLILLCSDGLTDMIEDDGIEQLLNQHAAHGDLSRAAEILIGAALQAGGRDNVSVILARAEAPFSRQRGWFERFLEWF